MVEAFYIVFGIPFIPGCAWLMFGKAEKIRKRWAAAVLLYGAIYIAVFHFWLKHI
jgi:hypothetical protein